jgi:hypothetical protein
MASRASVPTAYFRATTIDPKIDLAYCKNVKLGEDGRTETEAKDHDHRAAEKENENSRAIDGITSFGAHGIFSSYHN